MSDRLRLVTRAADGTPTTIRDLENGSTYAKARGSFEVASAPGKPIVAGDVRRYGGGRTVGEVHENASLRWSAYVTGATADEVIGNVEAMLSELLSGDRGMYLEWRPDGATSSVFREVRGPASYSLRYQWAEFAGARVLPVDVQIPVAPLAEGQRVTTSATGLTFPAVVPLAVPVPGTAPAKMDLTVFTNSPGSGLSHYWGLVSWWKRQGTPAAGCVAPFGVHQSVLSGFGWGSAADSDALGGSMLERTPNPADGTEKAEAILKFDPTCVTPDDFEGDTRDLEVWARMKSGTSGIRVLVEISDTESVTQNAMVRYTAEYGTGGRSLGSPGSSEWRWYRLGVLPMPVRAGLGPMYLTLQFSNPAAVVSWPVPKLDCVVVVPARQRAMMPTGKATPAAPGRWQSMPGDWARRVNADLTSDVAVAAPATSAPAGMVPGRGLGGAPIHPEPGATDVLALVCRSVPDNPSFPADVAPATGNVVADITARHFAAAGA